MFRTICGFGIRYFKKRLVLQRCSPKHKGQSNLGKLFLAYSIAPCNIHFISEIPRRGRSRGGAFGAKMMRPICAKLPVLRFVHSRRGAQKCRKFVANLKVNFGQIYTNNLFSNAPFSNFPFHFGIAEQRQTTLCLVDAKSGWCLWELLQIRCARGR